MQKIRPTIQYKQQKDKYKFRIRYKACPPQTGGVAGAGGVARGEKGAGGATKTHR